MSEALSFTIDAEFLDEAFAWITTRARRLTLERQIRDAKREDGDAAYRLCIPAQHCNCDDDAVQRVAALHALEDQQHGALQARRAAHRTDVTAQPLGIDLLASAHELGEDEEIVILTAACGAISEEMSNAMYGDLAIGFYGNATMEGISRLLDAQNTAGRLAVRGLFRDDAALLKGGLIVLDHLTNRPTYPDDLLGARLRITAQAFSILVGEATCLPSTGE